MVKKFLRTGWKKRIRLGRRSKNKQKWRRARGRHSKIREKRKGRIRKVEVGYRTSKMERGKIKGKIPVLIRNLKDAEKISEGNLIILSKFGKRKRKEIENKVKEKGGIILNIK